MEKEKLIALWIDSLERQLAPSEKKQLEDGLSQYPELQAEIQGEHSMWDKLESVLAPNPSQEMDTRFQEMLVSEKKKIKRRQIHLSIGSWLELHWKAGLAFGMIGLVIGYLAFPKNQSDEFQTLAGEMQEMKKMMMLTLIEQPQAQERIRAVSMAKEFRSVDDKVIEVLGQTLADDENINVRLAAIESLVSYWDVPKARETLVANISSQSSPIIQSAIADAMLALGEKNAIEALEELVADETTNAAVKEKIEITVDRLRSI